MYRLIFLFLLFVGCSIIPIKERYEPVYTKNPPYFDKNARILPIVIDKTFSINDKRLIDDSINTWNYVLNGNLILKVENYGFDMEPNIIKDILGRNGLIIMKIDSKNPMTQEKDLKNAAAWVNKVGGNKMWLIRDRFESEDVFPITLHELGHALGAGHEEFKPANEWLLMYPYYGKDSFMCVDRSAAQKVAIYQMILFEKMNYCNIIIKLH